MLTMRWPLVSRRAYDVVADQLRIERDRHERTLAALLAVRLNPAVDGDTLATMVAPHAMHDARAAAPASPAPVRLAPRPRDPVTDAIAQKAGANTLMRRQLAVYARNRRLDDPMPSDKQIAFEIREWRDATEDDGLTLAMGD